MIIGFTGSRQNPSRAQVAALLTRLQDPTIAVSEAHHGDCVGNDAFFHAAVRKCRPNARIVIHPPTEGAFRAHMDAACELPPLPYLDRNHAIVDTSDILWAFPNSMSEVLRSGTWSTIRYATRRCKPIWIVFPDGSQKEG